MTAAAIRTLDAAGVAEAVEWAAREGWNPGLADAAAFLAQDPGGFLGLFLDADLAATVSAIRYADGFAFVGFYICRPDLRGRGHGLALWRAAMAALAGRVIGLDGVVARQASYARSGFVLAHRNIRYGGPLPAAGRRDPRIRDIATPSLHAAVCAHDAVHFGHPRPAFLDLWLAPRFGRALALVDHGQVRGYGVVRRCRAGCKVGPLFADDAGTADALFAALAAVADGGPLYLDVPAPNAAARALAQNAGLVPVFETARMYKGPAPDLPLAQIFGLTSFELG